MKRCWLFLIIIFGVLARLFEPSSAADEGDMAVDEYNVRVAIMVSFTKFIDWPDDQSAAAQNGPFIISVVGSSPIITRLKAMAKNTPMKNRPVQIHQITEEENIPFSHIIYIAANFKRDLERTVKNIDRHSTLLISENEELAKYGALVYFVKYEDQIRFKINLELLKESRLKFDANLIKLGQSLKK